RGAPAGRRRPRRDGGTPSPCPSPRGRGDADGAARRTSGGVEASGGEGAMTGRTIEERWQELTAAALLGVERQAPPLDSTGTAVDRLLERIDPADRAGALLDAAAALALYRRAGQRAVRLGGA